MIDTTFYGINHLVIEKQITSNTLQNNSYLKITSVNNILFNTINNGSNIHYLYIKYPEQVDFLNTI